MKTTVHIAGQRQLQQQQIRSHMPLRMVVKARLAETMVVMDERLAEWVVGETIHHPSPHFAA